MQQNRLEPVQGPVAWYGPAMAEERSWIYRLSEHEIQEIEQALAGLPSEMCQARQFSRKDFPLPNFGNELTSLLEHIQSGRGFALIRGLPLDRWSREQIEAVYWGIGSYFGEPISQNAEGQLIAEVTNRGQSYENNTNDRGYRSRDRLHPHVDTSDVTALLCLQPAKSGGHSSIASSLTVLNELLERHPEHIERLASGYHHDLRGEGPTRKIEEVTHNRIPVFSAFEGKTSCCLNYKIMKSAHDKVGEPFVAEDEAALGDLVDIALSESVRLDMQLERGDIQLVNNYVLLHWRTEFEDWPEPERRRCLLRMWLNTREPRPLAPEFADRYNTGPRGGVWSGAPVLEEAT
ncbi:MAG: TauD/TfdA family dioxygenase [Hyphomicrobiaceae bacterium]